MTTHSDSQNRTSAHQVPLTDELRSILEHLRDHGHMGAALALQAAETYARTGCQYGCVERGASTYCTTHNREQEGRR